MATCSYRSTTLNRVEQLFNEINLHTHDISSDCSIASLLITCSRNNKSYCVATTSSCSSISYLNDEFVIQFSREAANHNAIPVLIVKNGADNNLTELINILGIQMITFNQLESLCKLIKIKDKIKHVSADTSLFARAIVLEAKH